MKKTMSRSEFKKRWESDDNGGGITLDDVADCAVAWGICAFPRTRAVYSVLYDVLKEAGCSDCESYNPMNSPMNE